MPYPVYSFVITEEVINGELTKITESFKTIADAKVVYENAVISGKRAFLYEQPQPDDFHRNDSQPFSA